MKGKAYALLNTDFYLLVGQTNFKFAIYYSRLITINSLNVPESQILKIT